MRPFRALGAGALLWLSLSAPAPADDIDPFISPFSHEQLLLYFDRADRSATVEQWLQIMEIPMEAVPDWERERARREYEARLAGWLRRSWRGGSSGPDLQGFLAAIEEANRRYLFATEASGAISLDAFGDPLLRPADQVEADHTRWREELGAQAEQLIDCWEREAAVSFQEILARLQPEARDRVGAAVCVTLKGYCAEVRREFDRLYRQAESRFLDARLRDRYSLRSKSESRTAGELAEALVRQTRDELDRAVEALALDADAPHREAGLSLDPRDWQQQFLAQFESGIEAWDRAEQRLLEERIRWESEAREGFRQAESAWDAAFAQLECSRESWLSEMNRCLSEGRAAWDGVEAEFLQRFTEAAGQLAESSRAELLRLRQEVAVLVGSYRQCLELIELAERNADFLAREIEAVKANPDGGAETAGDSGTLQLLEEELAYWQGEDGSGGLLARYQAAAEAACGALLELESRVRGFGGSELPTDSLEREVARLEAERACLQRQVEIAEAVQAYARDSSPERAREAETAEALERAQEELQESGARYAEALGELERLVAGELRAAPLALQQARGALEQARASLDLARRRYDEAWSAWNAQDPAVLGALVAHYAEAIQGWYCSDRTAAYRRYFAVWEAYQGAELRSCAGELLRDLLGEGGGDQVPDLLELESRSRALSGLILDWEDPALWQRLSQGAAAAGIDPGAPGLAELGRLVEGGLAGDLVLRSLAEHRLALLREGAELELFRYGRLAELLQREVLSVEEGEAELRAAAVHAAQAQARHDEALEALGRQVLALLRGEPDSGGAAVEELAALLRLAGADSTAGGEPAFEFFLVEGVDLRELFLQPERRDAQERTAALELYQLFGRLLPCLSPYFRWSDAAAWRGALGVEEDGSGRGKLAVLESPLSRGALEELCRRLAQLPASPAYLEDVAARLLAHAASGGEGGSLGLEVLGGGSESAPDDAAAGAESWLARVAAVEVAEDRRTEDAQAYADLLIEALALFAAPDWSESATSEEARGAQLAVLSGERAVLDWLSGLLQAEAAQAAWAEGFAAHREAVLGPLLQEMTACEAEVARRRGEYELALQAVASAGARYDELYAAADQARGRYAEARLVAQEAEEIYAYAVNAYPLETSGPDAVLAARRQALQRVVEALEILHGIEPLALQRPFAERMDSSYGQWKEQESALIEGLLQLIAARESMEGAAVDLQDALGCAAESLSRAASEVFSFFRVTDQRESLEFAPDASLLTEGELTDFRGSTEAALAESVEAYFAGDRLVVSERFSTDVVLWLQAMASYGDDCPALLQRFGAAYYYDAAVQDDLEIPDAPTVSIGILSAASLQTLVGPRYLDLGGRWVEVCVGSREDRECHQEYRYPEDKLSVQDYLAGVARRAYQGVQGDSTESRLYAFFKAMLASGHLVEGTRFVGKDLAEIAYRYVEGKAASLQGSLGQWWKFLISPVLWVAETVKAHAIQELRDDLATRRVTGAGERTALAARAADADRAEAERREAAAALELLCAGSGGEGIDARIFLEAVTAHSGRSPTAAVLSLVEEEFSRLDIAQRGDACSAVEALQEQLEVRLAEARLVIRNIAEELLAGREVLYQEYQEALYGEERDRQALASSAGALYWDPGFSREDVGDYEVRSAAEVSAWSRRGEILRLELFGEALVGLLQQRLDTLQGMAHERLLLQLRELGERRLGWERTMAEVVSAGAAAWRKSAERMVESRLAWYEQFEEEYLAKRALWEDRFRLVRENRELWVRETTAASLRFGAEATAREAGLQLDALIAESELLLVPDVGVQAPDPGGLLRALLGASPLGGLVEQARALVVRAGGTGVVVAAFLPRLSLAGPGGAYSREIAGEVGEEIFRRAALVTALQMRRAVEEAELAAEDSIARANADMDRNLSDTMASTGYTRSGMEYRRVAAVDHTLLAGTERERQSVPAYTWFVAPPFELGVDLGRETLEGRSGDYIRAAVEVAQENLQRYMKLIFGRSVEEREGWSWSGVGEELEDLFAERMAEFRSSAGYDRKHEDGPRRGEFLFHDTEGLFNLHIGYEPIMDDEDPERVKQAGFGELGRIMVSFFRNEARLARGLALVTLPWYNQRLWDDDADNDGEADTFLPAPTVRTLTNIAVSIAATATGQVWLAAALNLADDFVFTVADVASNFLQADQAFLAFGKQALVSVATTGVGAGLDTLSSLTGAFGESVIGTTLFEGIESLSSNVAASAIGAVELGEDGLSFDTDVFVRDAFGRQALAAYAGTVGGTLVSSSLGELNLQDSNDVRLSSTVFQVQQIRAFNTLAGGAVSAGIEYATGGQTTLNLLNFRDVAQLAGWDWFRSPGGVGLGRSESGAWLSHGLLELRLGGETVTLAIGQRGADVSVSALVGGTVGFTETLGITGFKIAGVEGQSTLSAVNLLGYSSTGDNLSLARAVFERAVAVQYADLGSGGGSLPAARGYVDRSHRDGFVIACELLGGGLEGAAELAALFSHEGTHLSGNRTEALAYMREGQTYLDLMRQFGVADVAYLAHLSSELLERSNWLENSGDRDSAEWFRTERFIGIRASGVGDFLPLLPVIGGLMSGVATFVQGNPYTDAKLPTSAIDERRYALEVQKQADRLGALISVGSLVAAAIQAGAHSGMTVQEVVSELFDYNPTNATSWSKAVDLALNYTDLAHSAIELLDRGDIRVDRPQGFERFKESVLVAERFKDIRGYWTFEDSAILRLAEEAGVPLVTENRWAGMPELEAQAINELINNFNFVSALYQMGVRDPGIVSDLYYKGIPYSVTDPDGTVWFFNSPGFAETNRGLTSDYLQVQRFIDYQDQLEDVTIYNVMCQALAAGMDSPYLESIYGERYRAILDSGRYQSLSRYFWDINNRYEYLFLDGR